MSVYPKISIVTPAFNCADFLEQCIESILAQNYQNLEHIIVDGASTDGTVEVLKRYSHLKWISEPDHGEAEALNKALRMATGDIVGWIGADDRYCGTEVFQHVASKARELSGSYVLYGKGLFINERGEALRLHIPKNPITHTIVSRWFDGHGLFQPSMFYSKSLLDEMGEFREDLPYGIDYEFWLRITSCGKPFHYIDHILGESREGGRAESKSVTAPFETRADEWTKISAAYQAKLSRCEQINFWKDYFVYRINSQGQYSLGISIPEQECELLGLACALDLCNHVEGLRGVYDRVVQLDPTCEEIYWLLSSCLTRNGMTDEAGKIRELIQRRTRNVSDQVQLNQRGSGMNHMRDNDESNFLSSVQNNLGDKEYSLMKEGSQNVPSGEIPPKDLPIVSVIIPTYNRPERLVGAVKSVLAQTYEAIEVIVINDGGCDVEAKLSSLSGSEKIVYVRLGQNKERSHARNVGIKLSKGKYIAYLDDDDRFYVNHIETLVSRLEQSGEQVAYTDALRVLQVKENGQYILKDRDVPYSVDFNKEAILRQNYIPILCLMHAKTCIERVGGFDESLSTHEDWDLIIRLSRSFSLHHIKSVTAEFTWRTDGTTTTSQRPEDFLKTQEIIHERYRMYRCHSNVTTKEGDDSNLKESPDSFPYDCSIIIPVFNKVELTQQCLAQLAKVTDGVSYEVIVVDNHSTDGTQEFLKTLKGDVQIILNEENFGFARGCNQGAQAARGKYLVFLNNDTIPQSGWLKSLVDEAETADEIAIVGSKLLFADGSLQHAGVVFSRNLLTPYHIYRGLPNNGRVGNRRREFQAVTAACMLVKRPWFEDAEGYDEHYKNGFEDIDLCLRIGEQGGKIIYQPQSWMYHLESQSPGRKNHEDHNVELFLKRWRDRICVDEDFMAFEDGLKIQMSSEDNIGRYVYRILETTHDSHESKNVADLQRLLFRWKKSGAEANSELKVEIDHLLRDDREWPDDSEILKWLGETCASMNLDRESEHFFQRVLQLREDLDVRKVLAKMALSRGDMPCAQSHIDQAFIYKSDDGDLWNIQGVCHIQCQRFADAVLAFERAIQASDNSSKSHMGLGMAYVGLGKPKQAWNTFKIAWNQNPDDVEIMNWLIQIGTELADWNALALCLTNFVERNPVNCDMRYALAGVQVRRGNIKEAQSHLQTLELLRPDYVGLHDLKRAVENGEVDLKAVANS